jgi:predicted transcriptional regulator of viral defense system
MAYQSGKPIQREISALAAQQGGYFTAKQAEALGYERRRLAYHVDAGNFERVDHGLYRLPVLPISEHDDLVRATFWSRDRTDAPRATVSHRTALALHGLSDLFAGAIHLTVPPGFRKRPPSGWVLHRATLGPGEREEREGFWITTPVRTLLDVSRSDDVGDDELAKAVQDALDQGVVSRKRLVQAASKASTERLCLVLEQEPKPGT